MPTHNFPFSDLTRSTAALSTNTYSVVAITQPQVIMANTGSVQKGKPVLNPKTLFSAAKKVVAIEVDERMVAEVKKRVMGTANQRKLEIIQSDALKAEFPFFDLCIANLPYAISSPVTFKVSFDAILIQNGIVPFKSLALQVVVMNFGHIVQ